MNLPSSCLSRCAIDWADADPQPSCLLLPPGSANAPANFDEGALVLTLESEALDTRHQKLRMMGASWDLPRYQPHLTLGYGVAPPPIPVAPFSQSLLLGPECFATVD